MRKDMTFTQSVDDSWSSKHETSHKITNPQASH
jgi:galactokinase/mevalonate kinase-like predicted kinase